MQEIEIRNLPIDLVKLVKYAGLAESGGQAKQLISAGEVRVNGAVVTQKSFKVNAGDQIQIAQASLKVLCGGN